MNIDDLTIKEGRTLARMFNEQAGQASQPSGQASQPYCPFVGQYVVVRTHSAGVHVGVLQSRDGKEVVLSAAKRIWQWQGANTLHEVAKNGISTSSKVSEEIPTILLIEAIEVITMSKRAESILRARAWGK